MSTPTNNGEDDLDNYPILKKYKSIPAHLKPDDDHPDRKPILTEAEEEQMAMEILQKNWDENGNLKKRKE